MIFLEISDSEAKSSWEFNTIIARKRSCSRRLPLTASYQLQTEPSYRYTHATRSIPSKMFSLLQLLLFHNILLPPKCCKLTRSFLPFYEILLLQETLFHRILKSYTSLLFHGIYLTLGIMPLLLPRFLDFATKE